MRRLRVEDSAGQDILEYDLVLFKTPGAHGDRGLALKDLPGKKLSVLCVDGAEVVVDARDVSVVDRSTLCRGMAVASARDSGGQGGIITGSATTLDLAQLTDGGKVVVVARDLSPAELPSVIDLSAGSYVVSGPWLGRVVQVSLDVDVLFDDGAVCRVADAGSKKLETLIDSKLADGVLYLGQQVLGQSSVFKHSRWLKGCWKPSREKGTVVKTAVSGVLVYWVASSQVGVPGRTVVQASAPPPAFHRDSSNLTFFCSGDIDTIKCFAVSTHYCLIRDPTPSTTEEELERAMRVVANTNTTVDVLWQDGTRQYGVPSASLIPLLDLNEYELIPGQRVVRMDSDANDEPRLGVVRSFNHKDQTACVSWFSPAEPTTPEETVSAYNLELSSNLSAYYGDVVVRLRPAESSAGEDSESTQEKKDLSWVGHITDLCDDGHHIQVRWGDGNMSKVLLHQVAVVKPQSIQDMLHEMCRSLHDSDDGDDDSEGDEGSDRHNDDDEDGPAAVTTTTGWAGAVIQAMIRLAGNVLAKSRMVSGSSSAKDVDGSPRRQAEADATGGDDGC